MYKIIHNFKKVKANTYTQTHKHTQGYIHVTYSLAYIKHTEVSYGGSGQWHSSLGMGNQESANLFLIS